MNVFDCHVNRTPCKGRIEEILYKPGKFFNASLDKASEDNERNYFKIKDTQNNKKGYGNFCRVTIQLENLDWLHLDHRGHKRILFNFDQISKPTWIAS